jgi:multidrug efflux pump subunit AcrA (membrane-fusion protein)
MVKASVLRARRAAALCAVLVVVAGCAHSQRPARATGNAVVPVALAQLGSVSPTTLLSGTVAPLQNVGITSTLAEPADAVNVQEGDTVRRGEVLAQLDTADLRAQLAADLGSAASSRAKVQSTFAQAGLTITQNSNTVNAAQAVVRQAQQTLATDTLNLTRDALLLKNGFIAQQQYDTQATLVKNDQQAVRSAQVAVQNDVAQVQTNGTTSTGLQGATVASARADEETALAQADGVRVQISKATIVSPIDGVVVNRNLNPGEFPGTRQIFTLQETDRVYAVLNGAGSQIVGIANGSPVNVTSGSLPGRSIRGTVVGVLNAVTPGSTNFIVKVLVANGRGLLRPGMVVSGTARLPGATGTRIPAAAFLDTTNSTVQIVQNGTVRTVHVTMLAQDDKNAIVTGLSLGMQVISNGQLGLADGQPVDIAGPAHKQVAAK